MSGTCAEAWRRLAAGDQQGGAAAFLQILNVNVTCREALRALHYQRWSDAVMEAQLPALDQLVQEHRQPGLLHRVWADWHYRVGDQDQAMAVYQQQWRGSAPAELPLGGLPQALVVGAPKSGTTSLMAWLQAHPQLMPHPRKELHFFQARWHWGEDWYRAQFPLLRPGVWRPLLEATPNYLQDPLVPQRVAGLLPEVKVVAVLREPLRRAVSWLEHLRRWGGLERPVDAVLQEEMELLEVMTPQERLQLGWWRTNALAGSLYADQLQRWRQWIPPHRLLVLRFEDLCQEPQANLRRVLVFLGADPDRLPTKTIFQVMNQAPNIYADPAIGLAQRCRRGALAEAAETWRSL